MRKRVLFLLIFLCLGGSATSEDNVQKQVVAGSFYPAEVVILSGQIDSYLKEVSVPDIKGEIIGLISPHAGYIYSGPVAAYGYKAILGKKFDTVVIIGVSHHLAFDGVAALDSDAYETPLGEVAIDSDFTGKLIKSKKNLVHFMPQAYKEEHSVEVQIPFLQRSIENFKIVPLIIGKPDYKICDSLAKSLVSAIKESGKKVLIIASTDLSHYYSYKDAAMKDQITLSELLKFDAARFAEETSSGECELCGAGPVVTVLLAGRQLNADRIKALKYANSGDITGDKTRVVGYASVVIYREEERMLNTAQKKRLLDIARKTIETYLNEGRIIELKENDPDLIKKQGAFVTLRKNGKLRGCIGNIIGQEPLYRTVRNMAIESATGDPRFEPVKKDELKDITIEISVLSEPRRVKNADEIEMGVHGVIVRRGFNSGVYLPQVASETGWTKEEFLSSLCSHKAGLTADAWQDKNTQLYVFTADVFEEGRE